MPVSKQPTPKKPARAAIDPADCARRSRLAQGLPETIEDPETLRRLARLVVWAERGTRRA